MPPNDADRGETPNVRALYSNSVFILTAPLSTTEVPWPPAKNKLQPKISVPQDPTHTCEIENTTCVIL